MLGGKFNNVLYDVNDPFAKYRELNDKRYVLDHFYVKLLNLQNTMQTECGRHQATVKTQYMLDFIQAMAIPDLAWVFFLLIYVNEIQYKRDNFVFFVLY